jgi:GntR family transcriptional regulator, transcriptional repressor for pyruvate dehydrogenase complex
VRAAAASSRAWTTSRFVLREGIENLLQLGTIETHEADGVRQILESPSARLAAMNRTEADIAKLVEIVDREAAASVDDPEVPDLDVQFHSGIAQASGNRVLWCLIFALHRASEPVTRLDLSPEVGKDTVRQHREIVKAIRDKDADAAERAIVTHLAYLRAHERDALEHELDS